MFKPAAMISTLSLALVLGAGSAAEAARASENQAAVAQAQAVDKQPIDPAPSVDERIESALRTRLVALGLTPAEADIRIAALTPGDLQKLAQNPEQVAMAGIKDTTLILIAVILVVPSLILLLMI